jgi:YebC/PmpR family DNA-binding regulatory protein
MSGHSKWAKIKRAKGAADVKKGAIFTKLARNIILAAKEGGGDADTNFSLRIAVDKAKAVNMPSDNIERSIKKGTGSDEKITVSRISYEAVANHGVNLMIDSQTDNSNRTVSEIKKTLENGGAKLASIGSVSWQFQEFGLIVIKPARLRKAEKFGSPDTYEPVNSDEIELELLEIPGVEDIVESEQEDEEGVEFKVLEIYTNKNDFSKVLKHVENFQYQIISFELIKKAKHPIELPDDLLEKTARLIENLEEHDDVDAVWTNLK